MGRYDGIKHQVLPSDFYFTIHEDLKEFWVDLVFRFLLSGLYIQ